MMLSRKPGLKWVHRTETSLYDWDETTLIQDGNRHTLSLAGIVPPNAKMVLLRVGASHASAGMYFRVSKVGDTAPYNCANVATQVAYIINEQTTLLDCTGCQIAYWASNGTFAALRLVVMGWFV